METKSMTTDVENAVRVDPFGIPLHPPPTTDPLDPLNWSRKRKALILFIVCFSSFLSVFLTGTPIASFSLLEEQFDASYSEVNWTLAIPSLGLGTGALLLSKLADTWGRRPVLISTCAFTMLATGCTTVKSFSYEAYMAFRFLQGLGAGPCTVIGFGIIRDISWEHERGFNVGLWVLSVDTGGIAGALLGGFTAMVDQYWAGYLVVIAYGLLLLLEVSLLPETLYPRELVLEAAAAGRPLDSIRRTTMIDVWNIIKVPGGQDFRPLQSLISFINMWTYPKVVCGLFPFVFFQYWWNLSFMTMEPAAYENFAPQIQGLLFLGIIVGTIVAELFLSGRLSDKICSHFALKNNNERTPEMRLYLVYPGAVIGAVGTILWGISIDRHWHWMVGQVAFFLFAAGNQISNSAVSTFVFDCYPDHIIDIMTFYIVIYNLAAFIEPWFINYWVESVGYTWSFVTQGLITLLVIPSYYMVQNLGRQMDKTMEIR